jgi:hypothetical protein
VRYGRVVLGLAAALTLTIGVARADAHKRKLQRTTTVEFQDLPGSSGDRISGVVTIGAKPEEPVEGGAEPLRARAAGIPAKCITGQKVLIKHTLTAEGGGADPPTVVATATTNAQGAWETTSYEASGANQLLFDTFQIEVTKKRVKPKNARHKHVCIGAFANRTVFSY